MSALLIDRTAIGANITFGSGENAFSIEFVKIGDPGNVRDASSGYGSVGYDYLIAVHEVSRDMITKANNVGGLKIRMLSHRLANYIAGGTRPNMAADGISWYEAAKFANYLNAVQGFPAAYKFDANGNIQFWQSGDAGFDPSNPLRNSNANFFIPTNSEWHKAAYYDGNGNYFKHATGSNSTPTPVASGTAAGTAVIKQPISQGPADITLAGGLSPLGTMGQCGNVMEWTESDDQFKLAGSARINLGGSWHLGWGRNTSSAAGPSGKGYSDLGVGFRVVSLGREPESRSMFDPNVTVKEGSKKTLKLSHHSAEYIEVPLERNPYGRWGPYKLERIEGLRPWAFFVVERPGNISLGLYVPKRLNQGGKDYERIEIGGYFVRMAYLENGTFASPSKITEYEIRGTLYDSTVQFDVLKRKRPEFSIEVDFATGIGKRWDKKQKDRNPESGTYVAVSRGEDPMDIEGYRLVLEDAFVKLLDDMNTHAQFHPHAFDELRKQSCVLFKELYHGHSNLRASVIFERHGVGFRISTEDGHVERHNN
ncbi:SUMF1/EgtB/PvdO family nonheme iron enzyme [Rhodopirellula sallentina]|uniref:SUMF1/EgtB/PvdO family nonheme iron enzyme n=1 Tax=Rhodopirellula sallentina TaxID=1263869 RepID=UPI001360B61A|nr:SUMF1/EgtB/PvdO family nonheme iron enzyme [Rhodopirellula sallentina]